jgi:nuclear pore complex protein Nup155
LISKLDSEDSSDQNERDKRDVLQKALQSTDQYFHEYLYDYFIVSNNADRLLEFNSRFLEAYLLNETDLVNGQPDNTLLELLWQYYARHSQYMNAANTLFRIATSPGLKLQNRLEYLTTAVSMAKSEEGRNQEELLTITDTFEVAEIQCGILMALQDMALKVNPSTDEGFSTVIGDLEIHLLDLQVLYAYSTKFALFEESLNIIFVSDQGINSLPIASQMWEKILENAYNHAVTSHQDVFHHIGFKVKSLG